MSSDLQKGEPEGMQGGIRTSASLQGNDGTCRFSGCRGFCLMDNDVALGAKRVLVAS